jgi:hypothetical protein
MSKHTPGPWRITTSWDDWMVVGPKKEEIIFQDGPYGTPTIKLENARLIAAAPDMLEALMNIENDDKHMPDSAWNLIQKAIAKATGETS